MDSASAAIRSQHVRYTGATLYNSGQIPSNEGDRGKLLQDNVPAFKTNWVLAARVDLKLARTRT